MSRRMQILLLALVAVLVIGQMMLGAPRTPSVREMWERVSR
ncbi:hypothetical protein [Alsobacter ponti]|nr:hypothetical protein [Alsobacter ponti]